MKANKQIYDIIFQEDDVTWQTMIYELARENKIDPWDVDISVLTKEFISMMYQLKEMNFRLSGKVILAAAILLKLKTERLGVEQLLMLTDPEQFPEQLPEPDADLFDVEYEKQFTKAELYPRIPGIRKRKVTMFELVGALKKALEVDERRHKRLLEAKQEIFAKPLPAKKVDILAKIEAVYNRLKQFMKKFKKKTVEFDYILPSKERKEVVWTIIPLLHLAHQHKVSLRQKEPFGKIYVDIHEDEFKTGLGELQTPSAAKEEK